jgi:hypothetical protein
MMSGVATLVRAMQGMGGELVFLLVLCVFAPRDGMRAMVLMPRVLIMALAVVQRLVCTPLMFRLPMFLGGSVVMLVLVHVDQR